jgi:DNA-binding SARP family transcriptional activator
MARLSLFLLGSFQITLDGEPVGTFESDKVRALLAYLAVESDRPQRRETLAGLLWPEWPERNARHSLSQALFNLRCAIGDPDAASPFLIVIHHTVQFNPASDYYLDVSSFRALLAECEQHRHPRLEACSPCLDRLQQAMAIYRGAFLEGFSVRDSASFEEWALLKREQLHRLAMDALQRLADCHERRGEYARALPHARRQVELDPLREGAHEQIMRLLALSGRRSEALAQYQACGQVLAAELGVGPAAETTALYEQIRDGKLGGKAE